MYVSKVTNDQIYFITDDSIDVSIRDKENIQQELDSVFTPELAYASYIPFCRIFGRYIHFVF